MIIFGSILIIGSTLFLCFLWLAAEELRKAGARPHIFWQNILLGDWITRAVTITAAIMRIAITAHSAVVAAMITSVIVESIGVDLSLLPILSLARAVNLSPLSLAVPASVAFRASPRAFSLPFVIIIASCVLTLGSQFISTILLSDFRKDTIAGAIGSAMRMMPTNVDDVWADQPWIRSPGAYWRFAEYHKPAKNQETSPYIVDTGYTLRASLPWTDENSRIKLMYYAGAAAVLDARAVCHSPILKNTSFRMDIPPPKVWGKISVDGTLAAIAVPTDQPYVDAAHPSTTITPVALLSHSGVSTSVATFTSITTKYPRPDSITVLGSVSYDEPDSSFSATGERLGPDFHNCTIPFDTVTSICAVDFSNSRLIPSFDEASEDPVGRKTPRAVMGFILFKLEGYGISDNDMETLANLNFTQSQNARGWSTQRRGPWTTVFNSSNNPILSLSHCAFDIDGPLVLNVTINGTSTGSEPTTMWLPDNATNHNAIDRSHLDTSQVRKQLGATSEIISSHDRGILSLAIPKFEDDSGDYDSDEANRTNQPMVSTKDFHNAQSSLFYDIMDDTGNPSLALQSLLTVWNQMEYFGNSWRWQKSMATYVMTNDLSIPATYRGLSMVIAMVTAHFLVLGTTLFLFLRRTDATMIGNAWQSVAQVVSDDTLPILDQAGDLRDKEVKKVLLAESGAGREMSGVIRRRENGKVQYGEK